MGPSAIRISSLAEQLATLGVTVTDKGDIPSPTPRGQGSGRSAQAVREGDRSGVPEAVSDRAGVAARGRAADRARRRSQPGRRDRWRPPRRGCAAAQQPLGLIWVDAHADINSPATSPSGNVHGMPLAALLGGEPLELARIGGPEPAVRPEHTVLVGIRNLDDREKEIVKASGVHAFTMKDIDRLGIAGVMERALAAASAGTGGIHVSFDLDACDPSVAPGVGTPVKGGLDYREAHYVMETVAESGLPGRPRPGRGEPRARSPQHHGGAGHRAGDVGPRQAHPVTAWRPGSRCYSQKAVAAGSRGPRRYQRSTKERPVTYRRALIAAAVAAVLALPGAALVRPGEARQPARDREGRHRRRQRQHQLRSAVREGSQDLRRRGALRPGVAHWRRRSHHPRDRQDADDRAAASQSRQGLALLADRRQDVEAGRQPSGRPVGHRVPAGRKTWAGST